MDLYTVVGFGSGCKLSHKTDKHTLTVHFQYQMEKNPYGLRIGLSFRRIEKKLPMLLGQCLNGWVRERLSR